MLRFNHRAHRGTSRVPILTVDYIYPKNGNRYMLLRKFVKFDRGKYLIVTTWYLKIMV